VASPGHDDDPDHRHNAGVWTEEAVVSGACPTLLLSTAMVSPSWELEGSVLMVREVRLNVLPAELDVGSSA
jgi:hypothetical protein